MQMIDYQKYKRITRAFKRLVSDPDYVIKQIRPRINYKLLPLKIKLYKDRSFFIQGASLFLTWRCNLSCKMCNLFGEVGSFKNSEKSKNELSLDIWKKIIDELSLFSPSLFWTGGEPFIYKDWHNLAKYIKQYKFTSLNVLTNGTTLKSDAKKIVETIDSLNISLDGVEDVHNKIRGFNVFDKIIEGIKFLQEEKLKQNKKTPYINIACTIFDLNYENLEELIYFIIDEKLDINTLIFQQLEFIGDEGLKKTEEIFSKCGQKINIWKGFNYKMKNFDIEKFINIVNKIKRTKYNDLCITFFPDFSEDELRRYYTFVDDYPQKVPKRCLGPWGEILITPEGNLWICPDYLLGNLKENSLKGLWNNDIAKKFRKKLLKEGPYIPVCRCCGCFYTR